MYNLTKGFAIHIIGQSHIDSGKPVQDFASAFESENLRIGIVSDGHGGSSYVRSNIGSEKANEAAKECIVEFCEQYPTWQEFCQGDASIKTQCLAMAILTKWQQKIEKYHNETPLTEEELKKVSKSFSTRCHFDVSSPYGCTLLFAVMCNDYYFLGMIGDGAIIKITPSESGYTNEIMRFDGKNMFEDQQHSFTDSMCNSDASDKFFFASGPLQQDKPICFCLVSDGITEAYASDEQMFHRVNNYLGYYAEVGLETSLPEIAEDLKLVTKYGLCKDDISLVYITNDLQACFLPEPPVEQQEEQVVEQKAPEQAEEQGQVQIEQDDDMDEIDWPEKPTEPIEEIEEPIPEIEIVDECLKTKPIEQTEESNATQSTESVAPTNQQNDTLTTATDVAEQTPVETNTSNGGTNND